MFKVFIIISSAVALCAGQDYHPYEDNDLTPFFLESVHLEDQDQVFTTDDDSLPHKFKTRLDEESLDYRLPSVVKPYHYMLRLQPFIFGNFSIHGYVEILVQVLEPTSNITLHIRDIITRNDTLKVSLVNGNADSRDIEVIKQEYEHERSFYTIHLNEELARGSHYKVSLHYTAYLNKKFRGFYRSFYIDDKGIERIVASTQFEATDARRAFPCFDEPALKASFNIHLARQGNMSSLSNMPMVSSEPIEGQPGWVWDTFATSVPMSTYLVAFVVSDYDFRISFSSHVLFRVWTRPNAIDQTAYASKVGPRMLEYFENYFNMDYPLPKMDMASVPGFRSGAMENWGLVLYRETTLLVDPKTSSPSSKQRVASVVAHELGHQWFGNLVSPDWWNDLWLNEGFASYLTVLGLEHVEPTWQGMNQFVAGSVHNALSYDSRSSSHPINMKVEKPSEISAMFDAISYQKGASIIRMVNHFITENSLRKGLTNYLKDRKYESAVQDDLWNHLTRAAHEDGTLNSSVTIKQIMDTWTLQKGYPLITLHRYDNGTATVSQKYFLTSFVPPSNSTNGTSNSASPSWWVPISWTSRNNADFQLTRPQKWLSPFEESSTMLDLPSKDNWVILNVQQSGFYRVNYDIENWQAIKSQLLQDHTVIHIINRVQILNDATHLAVAGRLNITIPMEIASYLTWEIEYVPIKTAFNFFYSLVKIGEARTGFDELLTYLLDIVGPLYDQNGFLINETDGHLTKLKKELVSVWACSLHYWPCIKDARGAFRSWISTRGSSSVAVPGWGFTVYCYGIRYGRPQDWEDAWDRYTNSQSNVERTKILKSLACSSHPWKILKYLEYVFQEESPIKKMADKSLAFRSIVSHPTGFNIAWDYIRANIDDILAWSNGVQKIAGILRRLSQYINTSQRYDELNVFLQVQVKAERMTQSMADSILTSVKSRVRKASFVHHQLLEWLATRGINQRRH